MTNKSFYTFILVDDNGGLLTGFDEGGILRIFQTSDLEKEWDGAAVQNQEIISCECDTDNLGYKLQKIDPKNEFEGLSQKTSN